MFPHLSNKATGRLLTVLVAASWLIGCGGDEVGVDDHNVTNVAHTDVEQQSIGNCWLYARASWVESMHLRATGESFDVSQSYWTYWHWFEQIVGGLRGEGVANGGSEELSLRIVRRRGLMSEAAFVPEDAVGESSGRQRVALERIDGELASGRLAEPGARADRQLVRRVLDEVWALDDAVVGQLDAVFGPDGRRALGWGINGLPGADTTGTDIIDPAHFTVRYSRRDAEQTTLLDASLSAALRDWHVADYPTPPGPERRTFQIRVQRALHDGNPVTIAWQVDFNALADRPEQMRGSFNLETLARRGEPGRQGGHMTVLEDYQVETEQYGVLAAGDTLDPADPEDAARLAAALLPSSTVQFLRIKNSWGALRPDLPFAPGFAGYHDLYLDYLDGPIPWCPQLDPNSREHCTDSITPWQSVELPPGY